MGFSVELSKFAEFDIVITVVDLMSKRTYFILTHMTVTVESTTRLFLYNIRKLHGFLTYIVSERKLQFIVYFTKELYYMLDIEIILSMALYSQFDGQIEHVN